MLIRSSCRSILVNHSTNFYMRAIAKIRSSVSWAPMSSRTEFQGGKQGKIYFNRGKVYGDNPSMFGETSQNSWVENKFWHKRLFVSNGWWECGNIDDVIETVTWERKIFASLRLETVLTLNNSAIPIPCKAIGVPQWGVTTTFIRSTHISLLDYFGVVRLFPFT